MTYKIGKMDIKNLVNYYISTRRGVGHTTLMKQGVNHYDKPFFVLGVNNQHTKELMYGVDNKNARPLSMSDSVDKIAGCDYPMIADNFVIQTVCDEYETQILSMEIKHAEESHELRNKIVECNKLNRTLSNRMRDLHNEFKMIEARNETMRVRSVLIHRKVKAKFMGMSLFDRIFRYNKTLDKDE